jgi:adenylate/guanylate cyclase family protein
MIDRSNRTFISSVLFLDIVEYTRQPVAQQIRLKNQFNSLVSELIADIAESDRIILDTGDGAALSFLGDPEDALFVAVKLRDALREKQLQEFPDLHIRMGINLGPVKLLKDINGRPNLIGDGINVAQRVMSFAAPDQILVSRSFYEVVSCLSTEYSQLFNYQGTQKDKHVREHELYEIGFSDKPLPASPNLSSTQLVSRLNRDDLPPLPAGWDPAALEPIEAALTAYVGALAKGLVRVQAAKTKDPAALREALAAQIPSVDDRNAFLAKIAAAATGNGEAKTTATPNAEFVGKGEAAADTPGKASGRGDARPLETIAVPVLVRDPARPRRRLNPRIAAATGVAALVLVAALIIILANRPSSKSEATVATTAGSVPPVPVPSSEQTSVAGSITAPPTTAIPEPGSTSTPAPDNDTAKTEAPKAVKKAEKKPRNTPAPVVADTKPAPTPVPVAAAPKAPDKPVAPVVKPGTIVFQVNMQADLWVDGVKVGDSTSMKRYALAPGSHRVEVRHCGFPPQDFIRDINVVSEQNHPMEARCTSS